MVKVSPPRAFTEVGETELTTNATVMAATSDLIGKRPLLSLSSTLWSPALGAKANVH